MTTNRDTTGGDAAAADPSATSASRRPRPEDGGIPAGACLLTIHGPGVGSRIDLDRPETTLGRGGDCDVVVPLEDVSRTHCRISRGEDGLRVEDLGSTNGTLLNERPLPRGERTLLEPGDLLNLGGVIFKVLDGSDLQDRYHEEVYRTAIVDGLTQIYNRRYLTEALEREMARSARYGREVSLVIFDVDHFKRVNDELGHLAGDRVLHDLARAVGARLRKECCFARYGGEEFAVVLPETGLAEARIVAERIRGIVEHHEFASEGTPIALTVSLGVAVMQPEMGGPADFFHVADEKLYEAKHEGRNRVAG